MGDCFTLWVGIPPRNVTSRLCQLSLRPWLG